MEKQIRISQPSKSCLKVKQKLFVNDCKGEILSLQYDPEDKQIAAACGDGQIYVFNAFTGKVLNHMHTPALHAAGIGSSSTIGLPEAVPYTCLRWKPSMVSDSQDKSSRVSHGGLVTTTAEGLIQHWHTGSSKCIHSIKEDSQSGLSALDFSPDGRLFAVGGQDTHIYLYDETTKSKIGTFQPGSGSLPGHSNRVFAIKFHPNDSNILISGGWDRTLQIHDVRQQNVVASIFGPQLSGDSLDIFDDMIVTGSNRYKDVMQIYSLSKRCLVHTFDYDVTKKDLESGFVLGAKFSKPHPDLIFAGGAGRNEVKIFENNIDGSQSMRIMATLSDFDSAVLSLDAAKNGESFTFGLQSGQIYVMQYKLEDLNADWEGYQDSFASLFTQEYQAKTPQSIGHQPSRLNRALLLGSQEEKKEQ